MHMSTTITVTVVRTIRVYNLYMYCQLKAYENLEPREHWRNGPLVCVKAHADAIGENARNVADEASTGDVRVRLDKSASHQWKQSAHVNGGRSKQLFAYRVEIIKSNEYYKEYYKFVYYKEFRSNLHTDCTSTVFYCSKCVE